MAENTNISEIKLQNAPKCLNWPSLIGNCYSMYHITGEHSGKFSYLRSQLSKTLLIYKGTQNIMKIIQKCRKILFFNSKDT